MVADVRGFEEREYERARSWRWLGSFGGWTIVNATAAETEASLKIEMASHGAPRTVELLLDGRPVAELHVPVEWTSLRVLPMRLAPGPHVLAFRPREPSGDAATSPQSDDSRRLTVAVGAWRWAALR